MVPIKLALRNFMCYRDNVPVLSFEGIHVACLCGDNGHGKSALLDAITWALWGKARAKSDDELIHIGQSEMEVEFEFSVGVNKYRVLRKRTKAGLKRASQPYLDLQLEAADGFVTISGNSIRETEQKIIELLRMDYDTFTNSALLLQGRADEFSIKKPSERKEVLARILGLSVYDELEKLAKLNIKEKEILYQALTGDISRIGQELEQKPNYESELHAIQKAIDAITAEIEGNESILTKLRQSREALRFKEEQYKDLGKQIEQAEKQLNYLNTRVTELGVKIERDEKTLAGYEENCAGFKAKALELETQERNLKAKREDEKEIANRIHFLRSSNVQLKKEMEELKEKIDLLAKGETRCPLCDTELGDEGRKRIMANYETQGRDKGNIYRANQSEAQEKEENLRRLKEEAGRLENAITTEITKLERQRAVLEKERVEAETALPREREGLEQTLRAADELSKSIQGYSDKRKTIMEEIRGLLGLELEFADAERKQRELREREHDMRVKFGRLQESLRRCSQLELEERQKSDKLREVAEDKSIYEELALAFGKKGVQALLIENTLPEIEEEANRLLGKMTNNRMHLKIESQRDTKKGDTIETLDIKIADELGTRSYEMFSGGEAFRVNFALRIALSKLLARRAGAPMPTLIIDEGFGTQDSSGREKLVEAISSIQDDFERILVITHIEELKDAFPVRIDVVKTEDGSTFSIS